MLKRCFSRFAFAVLAVVVSLAFLPTVLVSCETSVTDPPADPPGGGDTVPELGPWPPANLRHYMKRGVAFGFNTNPPNDGSATRTDMELLSPGINWFYNWSSNINQNVRESALDNGIVFIPQLWNASWNPETVRTNLQNLIDEGHDIRWIMTYNEPMLTMEANMTPARAAADWPRVVQLANSFDPPLKIVSPAMTFGNMPDFGNPVVWLREFFAQPGVYIEDMHAIRIHTYMSHVSAVSSYVRSFQEFGLPIWVTEFSAWYYVPGGPYAQSPSGGQAEGVQFQMNFMSMVLTYFELNPIVEKYFWFNPRTNYAGPNNERHPFHNLLYLPSRLTPLGVVYVNMPHFNINRKELWVPAGLRMTAGHITNATTVFSPSNQMVHFRPSTDTAEDREVLDIHRFHTGGWIEFQAEVPRGGTGTFSLRNMAPVATTMDIHANDILVATVNLTQSDEWRTTEVPLELAEGWYTIRLTVRSGNCAINWLMLD